MPARNKSHEAILSTARDRFKLVCDAESELRALMLADLNFFNGDQWPQHIKNERGNERPCLTINRLPQFVHQVVNDIRQNDPAALVQPVGDGADTDTAKIFQGLIRHIERQSKADTVRSYGANYTVIAGRGWYRITTDFESEDSFDQEIYLKRIKNQFSVYMDPSAKEPDYSDSKWCFIVRDYLPEDFKRAYPRAQASGLEDFRSIGDHGLRWVPGGLIRVAEYYYIEMENFELAAIDDGEGGFFTAPLDRVPPEVPIMKQRTSQRRVVKYCELTGLEVLNEKIWPGKWIPVIPILGEELEIDGRTHLSGMVRGAKDPQMAYNYWTSCETEMIALAPKAPFIGAIGFAEGREEQWRTANIRNHPYLEYNPINIQGTLAGPPQRTQYSPDVQALSVSRMQAAEDLMATTGIYRDSLGAPSNAQSGRAVLARKQEGDVANFHFMDALGTAIHHEARIYIDLIPKIYDRPGRVARIIGEDGTEEKVVLNQQFIEKGIARIYDLGAGRYDVAVEIGPSYSTQRQEAVASMMALTETYPPLMQIAGDLIVKNMDWPGAAEIAERLNKALPPQFRDDEEQTVPPAALAKLQQDAVLIEQLTARVNQMQQDIDANQAQIDSKERIELRKLEFQHRELEAETKVELIKLGSTEALTELKGDLAATKHRLDLLAAISAQREGERIAAETQKREQQHAVEMQQAVPTPSPQAA